MRKFSADAYRSALKHPPPDRARAEGEKSLGDSGNRAHTFWITNHVATVAAIS
jgi:hypothetical protein